MGSCILKFSLSPTFKLLFLCFSCVHFISTTSQIFPPLQGLACAIVNCGEGTCRGSNATLLGVECDCKPGWKQIPVVAFAFPSCALPNCTIDFQCGSGAPPPPLPALKPFNASSPCNLVWCGNGDCVVDETSNTHSCQCNQGFANLLNNPSFGCIEQCPPRGPKRALTFSERPVRPVKDALSRAAAEVYYRQLSKAREMRALSQTNTKLEAKVKSLQSKVAEHGQEKVTLVNNYNQKIVNLNAAHDKALREQKEAHDLAAEACKKEKDALEERVLELEGSVSALTEGHEAALADARNLGARNFMKVFMKKVPDFDWAALGASTARHADKLKLEMERDAQIAEEARLAAEKAQVAGENREGAEADNP
ncbi:hypothetical protein AgCh_011107 [Apium graveolens]